MTAMDLRQQRYMEYQRDFNNTLAQMMLHNFPDQGVQFPEFPTNMFVTAAPYTETTPALGGPKPFFPTGPQHQFHAAGPSRAADSATISSASKRLSKRRAVFSTPPRSSIPMGSLSTEIDVYVNQSTDTAEPSIQNVGADLENEGGTKIMETEDEGEKKVNAPTQRETPTRVQPPRRAKPSLSPRAQQSIARSRK